MFVEGSLLADHFLIGAALLIAASFIAGFIDSIAGGAGLVLIPSFILAGLPTQLALGQEKLVSTLGTLSAIRTFHRSGVIVWSFVAVGVPAALLGAYAGARAILYLDEETAGRIVALLLPVALMIFLIPRTQRTEEGGSAVSDFKRKVLFPLLAFGIGFYDGFFGPGTGTLLILAMHLVMGLSLVAASATSKLFNLASNVGAFIAFALAGKMLWGLGVPMIAASMAGNHLGSRMTLSRGDRLIRPILLTMMILLTGTLMVKYF